MSGKKKKKKDMHLSCVLKSGDRKKDNVRLLLDQGYYLDLTHKMRQSIREQNPVTRLEGTKFQVVLKLGRVLCQGTIR